VGEHDRVASGLVGSPPAGEAVTLCLTLRAAVDATVERERLKRRGFAAAELREGVAFPTVREAVSLAQLDRADGVGEGGEHAAGGADGTELVVVADEDEFGAVTYDEIRE